MSPNTDATRNAVSVAPLASSSEKTQASMQFGAHEERDSRRLSKVSTSDDPTELFAPSMDDHTRGKAVGLESETLITRLKLEHWRCGGIKATGEPCQRLIHEKRQAKIRSQLEKISILQKSNKNLDDELETLVMLVHCQSHDHGDTKEDRLELYITAVIQGSVDSTTSIERRIKKVLGRVTNRCIAVNLQNLRCGRNVGGQRVQNCRKAITEILQPDVYNNIKLLQGYLRVLEVNMYCPSHIDKQGYKMLSTWESGITEILEEFRINPTRDTDLPISSLEDDDRVIASESISESADVKEETVLDKAHLATPRNTRALSPEFYHSPSKFWPSSLDTSPFKRLPRLDGTPSRKECHNLVKKVVTRELAKTHNIEGYVYLYEVEGNHGLVKLGYTKRLTKRHKEWSFDCNRETRLLYPRPEDSPVKVPNVPRVEALCHSELDYCRVRVDCEACLKEHIEWFEISPEECIQVIKKWSQWMRRDPFANSPTGQRKHLKSEEMEKTTDMDDFMQNVAMLA